MKSRTGSDGCLIEAFQSNLIQLKAQHNGRTAGVSSDSADVLKNTTNTATHGTTTNDVDLKLLEVLRNNVDIVNALAKIVSSESSNQTNSACQMQGRVPRIFTSSPKSSNPSQHKSSKCSCDFDISSTASTEIFESGAQKSLWGKMSNEVKMFIYDITEAFEEPWEEPKHPKIDSPRLSATALRRDLKRCYILLHPLIEVAAALYDSLLWKNPLYTLLLALVYTYSIARGWLASLLLLLLWTQLSLNYLKATKNIDIGLYFLPRKEVAMPKFDITGAQMILDVVKIVQNLLNFAANFLEKVHSLLTWKNCRVTFVFYCLTIYWLTLSLIFNTGTCLGMCGMTLGVRIFITTYLFHRFPRLRKRLDTYGWFYRSLPVKDTLDISTVMKIPTNTLQSASRTASPVSRRNQNLAGVFTSRLGSNCNLLAGSQQSLNSYLNVPNLSLKKSAPDLLDYKGSAETLYMQSKPLINSKVHWNMGSTCDSISMELPKNSAFHKPNRIAISPLATEHSTVAQRNVRSRKDGVANVTEPPTLLMCSGDEEHESLHDDPMADDVLAYRSCVINDKEKPFPKGISSGILYLTNSALLYRPKSAHDHGSITMFFTEIVSVKKIQCVRTMGLLAGTRKSLEVRIRGRPKPLQFIGVAQRDDFCSRIVSACEDYTDVQFL
ncbi:hypothetical protein KIN20_022016 [Parelaphostrongylus tenuis]|uniref:GRAM domain-containing protein n=1 Tax=Parelaphostrongylus tenuis TaxID=148309 RepID=A0AAD5MPM8_PARTN|nr:hypothetical protein KIN20_022016 [Parelaphostrongylus tenuis]